MPAIALSAGMRRQLGWPWVLIACTPPPVSSIRACSGWALARGSDHSLELSAPEAAKAWRVPSLTL